MKVMFLVKGDEGKSAAEVSADTFQDALALKVNRFGAGLYVVEADSVSEDLEGAKALSGFLESVENNLGGRGNGVRPVRILADDASAFFCGRLYPVLCEFEVRLRAVVNLAMCADEDNFDDALVASLGQSTLEQLRSQLFDGYFASKVEKALKDKRLGKQELIRYIEDLDEGPMWDKLFGGDELEVVRVNFGQIKARRNDAMHFHTVSYAMYYRAMGVLGEVNDALGSYINRTLDDDGCQASREAAAQEASRQLAGNYAAMISAMSNVANATSALAGRLGQLEGIASALDQYAEIGKPARLAMDKALAAYDFSGIASTLSHIDFCKPIGEIPASDLSQNPACADAARKIGDAASAITRDAAEEASEIIAAAARGVFAGTILDRDEGTNYTGAVPSEVGDGDGLLGFDASNEKDGG